MLEWLGEEAIELGGTRFRLAPLAIAKSTPDHFVVSKPKWLVEEYIRLVPECSRGRVFELGIDKGGSTAFLAALLQPLAMVAIDIDDVRVGALDEFLARRQLSDVVHPLYGVDQSDRVRLEEILDVHFDGESLDLVIDDASHLLPQTMVSFDVLFPRLRPGGIFVIEDWSHDHTWERVFRTDPDRFKDELAEESPPLGLTRLVAELMLVTGYAPEIVAELTVRNGFAVVRRGGQTIDPHGFQLSKYYGDVARRVIN